MIPNFRVEYNVRQKYFTPILYKVARNIKSSPEGELKSLFTPLCKLFIGTLDVVAAADEVAGAFAVVDAGSGIVVSLGHAALFHHRVR